jgi:hypothetical protein
MVIANVCGDKPTARRLSLHFSNASSFGAVNEAVDDGFERLERV